MCYCRGHRKDYDEWADCGRHGWSFDEVLPYFSQVRGPGKRRIRISRNRRAAERAEPAAHQSAVRGVHRSGAAGRPNPHRRFQWPAPAWIRLLPGHPAQTAAAVAARRLPAARREASQSHRAGPMPRPPAFCWTDRRATGIEYRATVARSHSVHGRAGHSVRRRDQLTATADAFRHRPGRGTAHARHRCAPRSAGRRQEPAGSPGYLHAGPLPRADHLRPAQRIRRRACATCSAAKAPRSSNIAEAGGFVVSRHATDDRPDIQMHFVPAFLDDHGRNILPGHGMTIHACALRPREPR